VAAWVWQRKGADERWEGLVSGKKVLVLGDSHTRALAKAQEARVGRPPKSDDVQFDINSIAKQKGSIDRGGLELADALERVARLQPDDVMVISIAGTLHNIIGLLEHDRPFDVFTRGDESMTIPEGRVVVPENALWDMLLGAMPSKKIAKLRGKARCSVYHLATPPPKEDEAFIMARAVHYRDRVVAEAGLNPAATRLKLWKLEMRALAHLCARWNMLVLPPPAEAQTPKGFLKPEYYANDATHANAAYGELVLQQLERVAGATSPVDETA
jgi:hypothetical protein